MEFIFANCGPFIVIASGLTALLIWLSGKTTIHIDIDIDRKDKQQ